MYSHAHTHAFRAIIRAGVNGSVSGVCRNMLGVQSLDSDFRNLICDRLLARVPAHTTAPKGQSQSDPTECEIRYNEEASATLTYISLLVVFPVTPLFQLFSKNDTPV